MVERRCTESVGAVQPDVSRVRLSHADPEIVTFILPARLDRLAEVRTFVDSLDLASRLSAERIFDLKVAVSEAVANAIEHAGAEVRVRAGLLPDRVVMEISNEGDFGLNCCAHGSARASGSGLSLMVSIADRVTFVGARKGTTRVRLTFHDRSRDATAL